MIASARLAVYSVSKAAPLHSITVTLHGLKLNWLKNNQENLFLIALLNSTRFADDFPILLTYHQIFLTKARFEKGRLSNCAKFDLNKSRRHDYQVISPFNFRVKHR